MKQEETKPISEKSKEYEEKHCKLTKLQSGEIVAVTNIEIRMAFFDGAMYVLNQFLDMYESAGEVEEKFGEGGYKLYLELLGLARALED